MKRVKQVISVILIVILIGILTVSMIVSDKKNTYQGGEGTNFPYTWKEERGGSLLVKLDGSYGSETYHWSAVSSDENILKVEVVRKEKKGKITYRVTPLAEGSAQVSFSRERNVREDTDVEVVSDVSDIEDSVSGSSISGNETDLILERTDSGEEMSFDEAENTLEEELEFSEGEDPFFTEESAEMTPEELAEAEANAAIMAEMYDQYWDQYRVKDVIGEIRLQIDSVPSGRKGKLKLSVAVNMDYEYQGLMSSEDQGLDYKVWENSNGELQVKLPVTEAAWSASWEGEYIPVEDPGIPGLTISRPKMEDGRYIILRIQDEGIVEGGNCFAVQGLEQGTATLEFSNPERESKLVIDVEISTNGVVSVLSHRLEGKD